MPRSGGVIRFRQTYVVDSAYTLWRLATAHRARPVPAAYRGGISQMVITTSYGALARSSSLAPAKLPIRT